MLELKIFDIFISFCFISYFVFSICQKQTNPIIIKRVNKSSVFGSSFFYMQATAQYILRKSNRDGDARPIGRLRLPTTLLRPFRLPRRGSKSLREDLSPGRSVHAIETTTSTSNNCPTIYTVHTHTHTNRKLEPRVKFNVFAAKTRTYSYK